MKYFLDSYAIIEITRGNNKVKKYMDEETITFINNLAEMYYSIIKNNKSKEVADYFFSLFSNILIGIPLDLISKAMLFRYSNRKNKFSYTDCIGYVYARENSCKFVTGDKQFKGMPNVEFIN